MGLVVTACAPASRPHALAPSPDSETSESNVAPPPRRPFTGPGLCFTVTPLEADLEINGETLGRLADLAGAPRPCVEEPAGIYRIVLRADGYQTWRGEVSVREKTELIEVRLERTTRP